MSEQHAEALDRIHQSANRFGVHIDEERATHWLQAIQDARDSSDDEFTIDEVSGTFGHKVSMLDFSPKDLARFREIGKIVEVTGPQGVAESALALAGSAAQSKIQSYPGDADYFQRLNIFADTREEACRILAKLMRDHALAHLEGPTYQFLEAKFGTYPFDCTVKGETQQKGWTIYWKPDEVRAGEVTAEKEDGTVVTITWEDNCHQPGWCKLDWVVVDPIRQQLSNAGVVIDPTWEAPDGTITSLDGYLDSYFQEIYLEGEDVDMVNKITNFVSESALEDYVTAIEGEVRKYLTDHVNYGKAAKRMYNVFRVTGRHVDAAFVRELFDEPTTILYQVHALIMTLHNATEPGSAIPIDTVRDQADKLIVQVVDVLEGDEEKEIVKALLALRNSLEDQQSGEAKTAAVEGAQAKVENLINTFFRERLMEMPTIRDYIEEIQAGGGKAAH